MGHGTSRLADAIAVCAAVVLALAAVATLGRGAGTEGPLTMPAPLAAPGPVSAGFPEQSHISSCWVLANTSNALAAPRSDRASNVVSPIYAAACDA
jgi:hypothetical protein